MASGYDKNRDYVEEVRLSRERKQKEDILNMAEAKKIQTANKKKEVAFKAIHGILLACLSLFLLLHSSGIYLFTSGFLLTRFVLDHKSECGVPPIDIYGSHAPGSVDSGCWHPKKFNKAVVIIIDALRYDFTVPFISSDGIKTPQPYHNALPFLYDTAVAQPENAFLLPFLADPPTTTLQRLKGLTTGTLPTFIDAGSNFAGTAIEEDNLIAQLRTAGKNVVHLGDDTWHSLFPGYFDMNLTKAYDSFNVWDLHTLDNGVTEHILPLLEAANTTKWDVLIGHYLGVDHAGHRYGPNHPAMTAKLQQMDTLLRRVVEKIDDDTLLVVMGDHGMDSKGDHGGESSDELEAAIWMYNKGGHFGRGSFDSRLPPPDAKTRPIFQIDLVPSLALMLGLPIPFNNLGTPIIEAFIGSSGTDFMNLALVNRLTAAQIHRYQDEYALIRKPDPETLAIPNMLWDAVKKGWIIKMMGDKPFTMDEWQSFAGAYAAYQAHNLRVCKDLWARFDLNSMAGGILVLFTSLLLLAALVRAKLDFVEQSADLLKRGLIGLIGGSVVGASIGFVFPAAGLVRTAIFAAAMAGNIGLFSCIWSLKCLPNHLFRLFPSSAWTWASIVPVLLMSIGFAANSFTIWEDEIVLFFLAFFGLLLLAGCFRLANSRSRMLGCFHVSVFMIAIRIASTSRLCRDEQAANCRTTFYASATSSTSAPWQLAICYIVALILPSAVKSHYRRTQSYQGAAPFWIGIAFQLSTILIAFYWTLNAADDGDWLAGTTLDASLLKPIRTHLAQFIFAVAVGAGGATFAYQGPHLGVDTVEVPVQAQAKSPGKKANGTPGVQEQIETRPQLVVHGTSNLYGAHFATLPITILMIPLLLVQKPMGQGSLALVSVAILSLLEVIAILSPSTSSEDGPVAPSATTLQISFGPVVLALLGHFAFFKTGHQGALSSIQWDAVFIPLKTVRYPWSPILIILNTFGGQILCAACVPLCVLWRRRYRFSSGATTAAGTILSPHIKSKITPQNPTGQKNGEQNKIPPRDLARQRILSDVARAILVHILVYATINALTTVWAAHLRRHLMLYRVFSPRWMLGAAGLLVSEIVAVWVGLGGVGYGIGSVAGVFGWPVHVDDMDRLSVLRLMRSDPCIVALSSSLGAFVPVASRPSRDAFEPPAEAMASFVKRSETALSCASGGRRIFTSGSRQRGSCRFATCAAGMTRMGMVCVMSVSRSARNATSSRLSRFGPVCALLPVAPVAVVTDTSPCLTALVCVMDTTRAGVLALVLVSRIEALVTPAYCRPGSLRSCPVARTSLRSTLPRHQSTSSQASHRLAPTYQPFKPTIPLLFITLTSIGAGYVFYDQRYSQRGSTINPTTFTPSATVASREKFSSTSSILTLTTRFDRKVLFDKLWSTGIWSIEVKQPALQIARSYTPLPPLDPTTSVANTAAKTSALAVKELKFLVRAYPEGEMSTYLSRIPPGSTVNLRGGHMEYVLPDEVTEVVFLAGGTSIAPAVQVAHALSVRGAAGDQLGRDDGKRDGSGIRTRMTILWASRARDDAFGNQLPGDSTSSRGVIMEQLEAISSRKGANGVDINTQCFFDEDKTFIQQKDVNAAVRGNTLNRMQPILPSWLSWKKTALNDEASDSLSPARESKGKRLVLISGPDGFVEQIAGRRHKLDGQVEIGISRDGLLAGIDLAGWEVVKL
ncbi:hypothetical protein FH972_024846 [Carpinus fangiana]|uniref:FAD-binding FR-type domain-containing protein n=1 Tax=Carpinus fangiana TaxID=176857 RepID=A0A5N6L1S5_9ROSI|nr:hypothetical protein FH972_024846 [Carpinus fangiana]